MNLKEVDRAHLHNEQRSYVCLTLKDSQGYPRGKGDPKDVEWLWRHTEVSEAQCQEGRARTVTQDQEMESNTWDGIQGQ